jgi:hypothetical protein
MKIFTLYSGATPVEQQMLYGDDAAPTPSGWVDTTATPSIKVAPMVPQQVTRFQALASLQLAGLLTNAQAAVAAATDPMVALAWNNAQTFDRSSPTMAGLAVALGLTDSQVDDLFRAAAQIVA